MIVLMFIGASPGSTGGGIKTTTIFVLWATIISGFKQKENVEAYKRTIPPQVIQKAITVFSISLMLVIVFTAFIMYFEKIARETFKLNPAAQSLFDIDQGNFSFDSIEKQEKNKEFTELFNYVVKKGKVPQEDKVTIQLPIRNSQKEVYVKIIPIKDSEENVKLAIIFISANS